jgi:AraC-like DNA-binding protein
VPDFPPQLQGELLAALGGRLMALPYPVQGLAIRDFLAQPPGPACPGLLGELRAAALLGTEGLRQRERSLVGVRGAAHVAVSGGEHVRAVARRFALSSPEALEALEAAALPRALQAIGAGASVHVVVDGLGIASPARREQLERHATGHAGMTAVRLGECPESVAQRLGIRLESCVRALRHQAARRLVLEGRSVQEAAQAHGIEHPGSLLGLEVLAADVASAAIQEHGKSVHSMAAQLGITRPALLHRLEARAAHVVGFGAVQRGESVSSVAARLGLQTPEVPRYLADVAALLHTDGRPCAMASSAAS